MLAVLRYNTATCIQQHTEHNMQRKLSVKFTAGTEHYNNVNFATNEAQQQANITGKPVPVNHVVCGNIGMELFTVKPQDKD